MSLYPVRPIELCYQPIVTPQVTRSMGRGTVAYTPRKVEVLARDVPAFNALSPEAQLDHDLCSLYTAGRQGAEWLRYVPDLEITVNMQPWYFERPGFAATALGIIADGPLPPERYTLEIVETDPLRYGRRTVRDSLAEFCEARVKLALDDVGEGEVGIYARVRQLAYRTFHPRRFFFSVIKLDKSLIWNLDTPEGEALVRAYITLASNRSGMQVVAEGVETDAQFATVKRLGCHYVQGHRVSRKLTPDACAAWLAEQAELTAIG